MSLVVFVSSNYDKTEVIIIFSILITLSSKVKAEGKAPILHLLFEEQYQMFLWIRHIL